MSTFYLISLLVLNIALINAKLTFIEVKYPLLGNESPPGTPWPMPRNMTNSSPNLIYLKKSSFRFETDMDDDCDIIEKNVEHYKNILFPPKIYDEEAIQDHDNLLNRIRILIDDDGCPEYPGDGMDESYSIKIIDGSADLQSKSVWGAIRALETFSQLTFFTDDNKLAINDSTIIFDEPRFSYRGLLLDTSRHFIPVPVLKKQIDAMSYNKFNVFHWHIVDDQSFPLELPTFKNLSINGRYSKAHVYSMDDVKDIIDHARIRGIRVIPEFDSPGHVNTFGKTYPEFLTVCWHNGKPYQPIYGVQGKAEIFNPSFEPMYPVLESVLEEFKELFVDDYIHLGNDEVYYDCWKSNPQITEWMENMNFSNDYSHLQAYYSSKLLKTVDKLDKKAIVWEDVYENGVKIDLRTKIQLWKGAPENISWADTLNKVTADGYEVILSSPWYINYISYGYKEWYNWYTVEPLKDFKGTEEQKKKIVGGEVCLWSEYVDGSNIESRLWPRASSIAERLWSPAHVNDPEDAKFRLDEQRCRLLRRGIPASPVLNGYCGDYEYGMEKSVIFEKEFNYGWPN